MTGQEFLETYKKLNYTDRFMQLIMGDKYYLTLSPDEYQLLSDLNLIGSDDPEFETFLMQYMAEKIISFFNGCPDINVFLEEIYSEDEKTKISQMNQEELEEYIREKVSNWNEQIKDLLDNNKNITLTIPGDDLEI